MSGPETTHPMSTIETYNGNLDIPRYVATRAFLEIAANVLENPVLRARVRTWVVPGREMGLPEAAMDPKFVVPASMCPILVMWPEPAQGEPITNSKQQATLNVRVTLWLATLDPLDCMDLYGEVEKSLAPDSVANGNALRARLGPITGWSGSIDIGQPAIVREEQASGAVMVAIGSFSTRYNVPSF